MPFFPRWRRTYFPRHCINLPSPECGSSNIKTISSFLLQLNACRLAIVEGGEDKHSHDQERGVFSPYTTAPLPSSAFGHAFSRDVSQIISFSAERYGVSGDSLTVVYDGDPTIPIGRWEGSLGVCKNERRNFMSISRPQAHWLHSGARSRRPSFRRGNDNGIESLNNSANLGTLRPHGKDRSASRCHRAIPSRDSG